MKGANKMKQCRKITIIFVGDFYRTDFFGYNTLKDLMESEKIKRNQIKDWYKTF